MRTMTDPGTSRRPVPKVEPADRPAGPVSRAAWRAVPLTGRRAVLADLRRHLRSTPAGAVVLTGAVGVGKSRVMREVCQWWEAGGRAALLVTAGVAAGAVPLGALAPHPPAAAGLPELRDPVGSVTTALRRWGGAAELLLAVDDAHLLDEDSAEVCRRLSGDRCRLLLATRDGVPLPAPLAAPVVTPSAHRVAVPPLSRPDSRRLAGTALGGPLGDCAEAVLWHECGGNPLFLREMLAGARDTGALREVDGVWVLADTVPAPSLRLREIVGHHLGRTAPPVRRTRDLLAAVGATSATPADPPGVVDPPEPIHPTGVNALVRAGRHAAARYDFETAERLARAALADGDDLRAQLLLADALAGQGRRRQTEVLLTACGIGLTGERDRARLALAWARYHAAGGRVAEALDVLEDARRRTRDPVRHARIAAALSNLHAHRGDIATALRVCQKVLTQDGLDSATRLEVLATAALHRAVTGQVGAALAAADEGQRLVPDHPERRTAATALALGRCYALHYAGRLREAEAEARAALEAAVRDGRLPEAGT
jgi:hypothetical protein